MPPFPPPAPPCSYRKATIAALPGLTYLDDRPVTELERACAEAWWVLRGAGQGRRSGCARRAVPCLLEEPREGAC